MEASKLRIRCSSLGKIMTSPRSGGGLSETCKTHIQELYLEFEFGIRKEFWSRYTDKGIRMEGDSIRLANEVLKWQLPEDFSEYEQTRFDNDFILGKTDICTDWLLADVKTSWDANTFPFFDEKPKSKANQWQMQGYMWLTGHNKADLAYCLVNTPEDMVLDEIRREHWKQNSHWQGDEDEEIVNYVRSKHNFDHIPKHMRVKNFVIEYDEAKIERIKERVAQCREYYQELLDSNVNERDNYMVVK